MRYLPANGTAGLARWAESTLNRSPCPPARMTAATFLMAMPVRPVVYLPCPLQQFEQHRVNVPEEPPEVGQKRLPRHRSIGNDVGEDGELCVARHQPWRRRCHQVAALRH